MIEILNPIVNQNTISYPVIIDGTNYDFKISYTNIQLDTPLNTNIDGIVVLLTSIAICNKWPIRSTLEIDESLYDNLLKLPEIYKKYHHKHTSLLSMLVKDKINLVLDLPTCRRPRSNTSNGLNANISPLSMGIDSLHTLITQKDNLTHLIYINDLDLSTKLINFNKLLTNVSTTYNKPLIIANSNIKKILGNLKIKNSTESLPGINYAVFTGDAMMLANCYPLGINTIYFSGFGGNIPCIMGQHTDLNQYYKSNEFFNVQNETMRIKKIKYIIENDPSLLNVLRVCNDYTLNTPSKVLNCTKCGKCTRTLLYLYMLGYYDKAVTFIKPTFIEPNDNYLNYYMRIFFNAPNKTLATTYYDKILTQILKIYTENNNSIWNVLQNYNGTFNDDDEYTFN
jgi:hypothetical protein